MGEWEEAAFGENVACRGDGVDTRASDGLTAQVLSLNVGSWLNGARGIAGSVRRLPMSSGAIREDGGRSNAGGTRGAKGDAVFHAIGATGADGGGKGIVPSAGVGSWRKISRSILRRADDCRRLIDSEAHPSATSEVFSSRLTI